jgi:hypothetical protein
MVTFFLVPPTDEPKPGMNRKQRKVNRNMGQDSGDIV